MADPRDAMFDTSQMMKDLGSRAGNASIILLVMSVLKMLQQILSIALLARLVGPEDYGVFALAMPGVMLALALSSFGLPQAIIQKKEITHSLVSTLFWLNVGFGIIATVVVAALAWPAAAFFHEPRVVPVFQVISLAVLFSALSAQYIAILRRQLRVRETESITLMAEFVGIAVAVVAALSGLTYWALALQQVVVPLVTLLWLVAVSGWRPSSPHKARFAEARAALSFGGYVAGFSILNRLTEYIGTMISGRMFDEAATGLFYRARNLAAIPQKKVMSPLGNAFVPTLSRLQDDPEVLSAMFHRLTTRSNLIMLPIAVIMAAAAHPLTAILLGDNWSETAPLLFWLSIFTLRTPANASLYFALIACGQGRPLFFNAIARFVLIALVMMATAHEGLVVMTAAYMLLELFVTLPMMARIAIRHTPLSLAMVVKATVPDLVFAAALGLVLCELAKFLTPYNAFLELAVIVGLTGIAYGSRVLASPELSRDVGNVLLRVLPRIRRA